MRVYRVENPDTRMGPYCYYASSRVREKMMYSHSDSQHHHPIPQDTLLPSMGAGYQCAFNSMWSLFRWFGGYLPLLCKEGFKVVVLEADVIAGPDHTGQVVFYNRKP